MGKKKSKIKKKKRRLQEKALKILKNKKSRNRSDQPH